MVYQANASYGNPALNYDMAMEKRNGTLHFVVAGVPPGATNGLGQPMIYITVDQAGNVRREAVTPPPWATPLTGNTFPQIVLWEYSTTTFPVILVNVCDPPPGGSLCTPSGPSRIEVHAKINGVWQSMVVPTSFYFGSRIIMDSTTNSGHISVHDSPTSSVALLRWDNVSNPAAWTFTQTGIMTNWNTNDIYVPCEIFSNSLGNYDLAVPVNDLQQLPIPGRGIVFHNTQNNNQQVISQFSTYGKEFFVEFAPGLLGLTLAQWGPHPTLNGFYISSANFVSYADGAGILSSIPLETYPASYGGLGLTNRVYDFASPENVSVAAIPQLYIAGLGQRANFTPNWQTLGFFLRIYTIQNMNTLANTWDINLPYSGYGSMYTDIQLAVY